ncbi:hypothetical protein D9M71_804130 [compost metagenome]
MWDWGTGIWGGVSERDVLLGRLPSRAGSLSGLRFYSGLVATEDPCRSELAREKRLNNAINQAARVIVNVHREQARSYRRAEQRQIGIHPRFSPLNRPSVSSPAALDLDPPAPSAG